MVRSLSMINVPERPEIQEILKKEDDVHFLTFKSNLLLQFTWDLNIILFGALACRHLEKHRRISIGY